MSGPRPTPEPPVIPGFSPVRLLGSGGFADVFLYEQETPSRSVAVKVLHAASGGGSALAGRFDLEANLMARLSTHPSIATIYQTGFTADGRPFLVMEYCPNGSLDTRYRRERMGVAEVLRLGIQVAAAVEAAHRAGIHHRDIKPANILLTEYGRAALTDFGISVGDADSNEEVAGLSVPWSAPEVLAGGPADGRSADVYSLAATVYTLLAGRWPFEVPGGANDAGSLTHRATAGALPPTGRTDVPADLERTLAVGMASDPAQRFSTALQFARALQVVQVRLGEPVTPLDVAGEAPASEPPDIDSRTEIRPAGTRAVGVGEPLATPDTSDDSSPARPASRPTVSRGTSPPIAAEAAPAESGEPPDDTVLKRPPALSPEPPRRRKGRGAVLAVVLGAVVGAVLGGFVYFEAQGRGTEATAAARLSAEAQPTASPTPTATLATLEPVPTVTVTAAEPVPTTPTSEPRPAVTVTATAPPVTQPTRRGAGDLGLTAPIANVGCTGEFLLLVASTGDPALYRDVVTTHLADQPGAQYLRTDASCGSFHQNLNGNPIYAVYLGPYGSKEAACTALSASSAPVDAAVRPLVADRTGGREYCTCLRPPDSLPQLSMETASAPPLAVGRVVAEVQSMLYFGGFSPTYALDGKYGERMKEWVAAYQVARGLPDVGEVGPLTWAALRTEWCT